MSFVLHPNLAKKSVVISLAFCQVLLEDEKHYPWLILVPQKNALARLIDLTQEEQVQLLKEVDLAQKILWTHFSPTQLNVATIGNKTPQLHIHVIARFENDPAWPGTVWDHPVKAPYASHDKEALLSLLRASFEPGKKR